MIREYKRQFRSVTTWLTMAGVAFAVATLVGPGSGPRIALAAFGVFCLTIGALFPILLTVPETFGKRLGFLKKVAGFLFRLPSSVYVRVGWFMLGPFTLRPGGEHTAQSQERQSFASNLPFFDGFDDRTTLGEGGHWRIKTGEPGHTNMGFPPPSLYLATGSEPTHSFVYLADLPSVSNGAVLCDVRLDPGAILNVVFRANIEDNIYYMARLDTRGGPFLDGFFINEGTGWRASYLNPNPSHATPPWEWHRMRVEFIGARMELYCDGELVALAVDELRDLRGGQIGVFNEEGTVLVDNFVVQRIS